MFSTNSHVPQWLADLRARKMVDANPAAFEFWRMSREQFLTNEMHQFIHPDEMARWEAYIATDTWGESGPWKCLRGDGTTFFCTIRWQIIEHNGAHLAFVFPLRAGETDTTMQDLQFQRAKPAETVAY